jgi:hypothetical protein
MPNPPKPVERKRKSGNPGKRPLPKPTSLVLAQEHLPQPPQGSQARAGQSGADAGTPGRSGWRPGTRRSSSSSAAKWMRSAGGRRSSTARASPSPPATASSGYTRRSPRSAASSSGWSPISASAGSPPPTGPDWVSRRSGSSPDSPTPVPPANTRPSDDPAEVGRGFREDVA